MPYSRYSYIEAEVKTKAAVDKAISRIKARGHHVRVTKIGDTYIVHGYHPS